MGKKIVVIGGSAAGAKAAAKARRFDQNAEITIIQKSPDLSMASCGYPYYVGGFFNDRNQLLCSPTGVVRDPKFFMATKSIVARIETEVIKIDRENKCVIVKDLKTGSEDSVVYDKLIYAAGASARIPPVKGTELDGITTLLSMQDADYLRKVRDDKNIKRAVVIGGGLIGIETCEALQLAGIEVVVIEMIPQILSFLDWELAKVVENHMKSKKAEILTGKSVQEFIGKDGKLCAVKLNDGMVIDTELAVIATGVKPNSSLAQDCGLELGKYGGIKVNEFMQTTDPDIYAAGDCVEIKNRITGQEMLAPYGDLANLEGRVAGENVISGNVAKFPGTINTGICKVFEFTAGSTGLSESRAQENGFETVSVIKSGPDKPGFMNGLLLITKMVADAKTGKLLGVQCIGPGDVSKQIAEAAMAIQGGLTIEELSNADLPYAPPFSLAIDNIIATAHVLDNKMKGYMKGISCLEVYEKLQSGEKPFLLDVRSPAEFEQMRLGIGEKLIPLGMIKNRQDELPQDKNAEIICYCKISLRGYEVQLMLESLGWKNVRVMEGGVVCWPYKREK